MKSDSPALKFGVGLILALGILFHVAGINQPFLGNFAQHQTDYATVVQRWQETTINPALPVMRFIGRGQNRIFLGDFPLNVTAAAVLVKFTPVSIEMAGRGLSVLFFLLSLLPFYQIALYVLKNKSTAVWAFFFYLFSPLTIVYGQAFLLEMTALSFGVFAYYSFLIWSRNSDLRALFVSAFFFSMMLATRIYFAPVVLPLIFLFFNKQGRTFVFRKEAWLFAVFTLALPLAWQLYAAHTAQAQNDQSSLSDNMKVFVFADPILRKNLTTFSFYLPILKTAVFKVINPLGFIFFLLALFGKGRLLGNQKAFLLSFFISFLPLFLVAPRKFVEFDYYFLPFIPAAAILASVAAEDFSLKIRPVWNLFLVSVLILFSLRFSLAPVLIVPQEDRYVREMGKKVQEMAPEGVRVIAAHGSSTSLLYYTNLDGWAFELPDKIGGVRNAEDNAGNAIERLERFRSQGAVLFVTAKREDEAINPGFFSYIRSRYKPLYEGPEGAVFSLANNP